MVVIAIIITFGVVAVKWENNTDRYNLDNLDGLDVPRYDYMSNVELVGFNLSNPVYNNFTGDYRPVYPNITQEQYDWYFGMLPSMPKDFFSIAQLVYDGLITDYDRLSEVYYLQPEFYPGWWGTLEDRFANYDSSRWTPEGYGCYPLIKQITVKEKGTKAVVTTYFKTGYATNSYQGLIIRPYLPEHARDIRGDVIFDQPSNADRYISLNILNPDDPVYESFKDGLMYDNVGDSDWMTILKPTHQILFDEYGEKTGEVGFPSDWVRVLQLEITFSSDIPSGDYVVALKVDPPCFEINQEYYYSNEHPYYGWLYYPGGQFFRQNTPHFQVIVHIP